MTYCTSPRSLLAFVLLVIIVAGLLFLASGDVGTVSLLLAYAAGLSMIFLPCTLPLVFIIVPMTMGHHPAKGFIMALLFGLGVSITLAFYGIATAGIGSYLGLDKVTRIMFTVAGSAAFIFGLFELKLLQFTVPSFSGAVPQWIQQRKDYSKIFFMGLFLGNAGVGCPNPAFYVLLLYIASVGSLATGAWLGFIHGLGRVTPLIFLAILGILGFNSLRWVGEKKASIDTLMGWALVVVGVFIFSFGFFGMEWWEEGFIHRSWNDLIYMISPNLAEPVGHGLLVPQGFVSGPLWSGWAFMVIIIALIYFWDRFRQKKKP